MSIKVNKSASYCLNESQNHPYTNLLVNSIEIPRTIEIKENSFLQSDVDEQLLLSLAFIETISLKSLTIALGEGDQCPKTIKLFSNTLNMGFSEASDFTPIQEIEVSESARKSGQITITLAPFKWNRISNFSLFVEDNFGDEISVIRSIAFDSSEVSSINVTGIRQLNKED